MTDAELKEWQQVFKDIEDCIKTLYKGVKK